MARCPGAWRGGGEEGFATPGKDNELDNVDQDGGLPDLEAGHLAPALPALPPHAGEPGTQGGILYRRGQPKRNFRFSKFLAVVFQGSGVQSDKGIIGGGCGV